MLGQKLDYRNRKEPRDYDVINSFAGRYSDLTIWRGQVSEEQIKSLANCEDVITRGIVLDWNIDKYNGNEVDVLEYESSELCKSFPLKSIAIFNHGISHDEIKLICKAVGDGKLPTFGESNNERDQLYKELSELYESAVDKVTCRVSEYTNAEKRNLLRLLAEKLRTETEALGEKGDNITISASLNVFGKEDNDSFDILGVGDIYFWSGIIEVSGGNEFVNEYSYDPVKWDVNIWPGPISNLNVCTMARGKYLVKQDCKGMLPCGLCTLESQKRLKLKGLCVDDMMEDADFDTEYYAYGLVNGRMHFRYLRLTTLHMHTHNNS